MSDTTGNTLTTQKGAWHECEPPRTVIPRARKYVHMDMAAVTAIDDGDHTNLVLVTEHGELFEDVPDYFCAASPTIIITLDPSAVLASLHQAFGTHPAWKYTLYRTHSDYGDGSVIRVKLSMFGFRGQGFRKQRLHQCWDPRAVSPDVSARFLDGADPVSLLTWGQDVRSWAEENSLELRNAFAGYGAQLLRDPRFYSEPRRRVPRATNEAARVALPGNLVSLHAPDQGETYAVTCIDQRAAHHRIVQELALPSSNHLFARGYFVDPWDAIEPWCVPGDVLFDQVMTRHHGLLYVKLNTRRTGKDEFRLPVQDHQHVTREFVWTNTLDFLTSTGTLIEAVYAGWTSTSVDTGLSRYGRWAESQITHSDATRKRWLKPLLHSTYGLLAARPRPLEVGHLNPQCDDTFLFGSRQFPVKGYKLDTVSPEFVNVIQRGMIEAETQLRSITMARQLQAAGCQVLHIHSDGLHVLGQLPLLPDTWSVSTLTDVLYLDRVSWVAVERTCLPGRDRNIREEVIKQHERIRHTQSKRGRRWGLRSLVEWTKGQ